MFKRENVCHKVQILDFLMVLLMERYTSHIIVLFFYKVNSNNFLSSADFRLTINVYDNYK